MSDYAEQQRQCDEVQEELAELALGILTGRRRSEVLRHVGTCQRCSAELDGLSIAADTLLLLAPQAEPPVGFEARLAQRLGATAAPRPAKRLRHVSTLAAAAVLAIVLGFGIGALATNGARNNHVPSATANLTSAVLRTNGHAVGQVVVSAGRPAWMFMTVDARAWSGKVWCSVTLAGGKVEQVGTFQLTRGYGAWDAPLSASASQVRTAQLTDADGYVLASARLVRPPEDDVRRRSQRESG